MPSYHKRAYTKRHLCRIRRKKQDLNQFLYSSSPKGWYWDKPHLKCFIRHLEAMNAGKLKRLMIFCPPRHGKSALSTIRFPVYYLERHPENRVVVAAHTQSLANDFSRESRKIASKRYFEVNPKRDAVEDWRLLSGGQYTSIGVGGGITGRGADLLIIDDPVKSAEKAFSQTDRERVWRWYNMDISTRLEPDAKMILIMTRWHSDDLAGRILNSEEAGEWTKINLPAFAEENDLIGRKVGECLWKERFDETALERMRLKLGNEFLALYQQRPVAAEGAIFKTGNIQYYDDRELPLNGYILSSWDTAMGQKKTNDYSSGTTWMYKDGNYYLLNVVRERLELNALQQTIRAEYTTHRGNMVLIENKSNGESVRQEIQRKGALPIIMVNIPAGSDKVGRAQCVSGLFDTGRIFLPKNAAWLGDYLAELTEFPLGKHDDQVDSTTQALEWLQGRFGYTVSEKKEQNQQQLIETWRFANG